MKEKYPEIRGKCRTCLGCNLLERLDFTGYYRCQNYVKGAEENESRNTNETS